MVLARLWIALAGAAVGAAVGPGIAVWQLGAVTAAGGIVFIVRRRRPALRMLGVMLVACGTTGAVAAAAATQGAEMSALSRDVPRCDFTGRVLEQSGGLGTLGAIDRLLCAGRTEPGGIVMLEGAERLSAGALVAGTGWLLPLGDDPFGAARRRLGARAGLDPISLEVQRPRSAALGLAARLRAGLVKAAGHLSDREGSLLVGLTIGDTSGFDRQTIDVFRRTGLSHLLAVSGSNVAMVLACVAVLARRLAYRVRLSLGAGMLVLFVLIVGPDPSVLRAAVMGAVSMLALGWARRVDPLHSLGLALLVLLAARPGMVTSVGLHLSAAATLGIVLWARRLADRLHFLPPVVAIPLGLTLSAQFGVAPILIATFGQISLIAPVTNLLVGPAVWLTTLCGLATAILAPISQWGAAGLVRIASPALSWILAVADRGAGVGWASIDVAGPWAWPLASMVLAAVALSLRGRMHSP